jgi:hypothetical protein
LGLHMMPFFFFFLTQLRCFMPPGLSGRGVLAGVWVISLSVLHVHSGYMVNN